VDFSPKSGPTPAQFDGSKKLATMEAVQRALGSFSGESNLSATATLTATDVGKAVLMATSTGSQVLTLPAASAVAAGGAITIQSKSTVDFSVARAGTDTLNPDGNTITSITVKKGEFLIAESNGSNQWALYGSATLQYAASFASSQAVSGYQKLPGGLIYQWGKVSIAQDTSATVTFPIAFPNAGFNLQMSCNGPLATVSEGDITWGSLTTTNVRLSNARNGTYDIYYSVIGN